MIITELGTINKNSLLLVIDGKWVELSKGALMAAASFSEPWDKPIELT